jgi:hypothetical protein
VRIWGESTPHQSTWSLLLPKGARGGCGVNFNSDERQDIHTLCYRIQPPSPSNSRYFCSNSISDTMAANSNLVWVNKSRDSSSLSNCRYERDSFREIRSHAVTVGHKSSRIKRPIKRTPFTLGWARMEDPKSPTQESSLQPSSQDCGDNETIPYIQLSESKGKTPSAGLHRQLTSRSESLTSDIFNPALEIYPFSSLFDPFSTSIISLDAATLERLWYFENIWTQSAFKLPGCIGYGQPPIPQREITSMMQSSLRNSTRSFCLLAATSARMQYIHHQTTDRLAHGYAARALHGLQKRMQGREVWEEADAMDVVFLAAYEVFCEDKVGAGKHLAAVRTLYKRRIENTFVRRLQANLEILVVKSVTGSLARGVDRPMRMR